MQGCTEHEGKEAAVTVLKNATENQKPGLELTGRKNCSKQSSKFSLLLAICLFTEDKRKHEMEGGERVLELQGGL